MNRMRMLVLFLFVWLGFALRAPAPLIFTPGEGWRYEQAGTQSGWQRKRAKDQLEVADAAFEKKDYTLARRAAQHTVHTWPFSDYAPRAQYLLARCEEAEGHEEKAFRSYQKLIERYPKMDNYEEIVKRQFEIANRYLAGKWFKAFGYVPLFPSMDKTIKMYEQIIKNGPYSEIAPQAQMNIGQANERKFVRDFPSAAKAYERAADRYADQRSGTDALFKVGETYNKQAKRAEYDQSIAAQAISTFTDFVTLHPDDKRIPDAQKIVSGLKTEQARGSYEIAKFYEKKHHIDGALIYYNEVLLKDPASIYAQEAKRRIDELKRIRPVAHPVPASKTGAEPASN